MTRRELLLLLAGAMTPPRGLRAQQTAMPLIGILNSQTQDSESARLAAIREGLKEAGFIEGQNVAFEYRFADGQNDRLPILATELVRRQVSLIVANTTPPAKAAKAATSTIPIVFALGVDPVELGLVASFNRPGANLTGVAFLVNQLVGKRLELLCEAVPTATSFGMLADPNNPNYAADTRDARAAAAALGRTLHVADTATQDELGSALSQLIEQRVGALFVAPEANFRIWRHQVAALAMRHRLASSYSSSDFVRAGGLMSYGPDQLDSYRQAGVYAGRILKGEKPAEMPVVQPTKFEFVINLKTAEALGLKISPTLLTLTTEVLE